MEDIIYCQDPELSWEKFILKKDKLIIVEKSMGLTKERMFKLDDLASDCEMTKRRFSGFYIIPLILAGLASLAAWQLFGRSTFANVLAMLVVTLIPASLWHMIRGLEPIEIARFKDKSGAIVFELYRPRKAAFAYDEFVTALRKGIREGQAENR